MCQTSRKSETKIDLGIDGNTSFSQRFDSATGRAGDALRGPGPEAIWDSACLLLPDQESSPQMHKNQGILVGLVASPISKLHPYDISATIKPWVGHRTHSHSHEPVGTGEMMK